MTVLGRVICAIDKVIKAGWCTPDDLGARSTSEERREVEEALSANAREQRALDSAGRRHD